MFCIRSHLEGFVSFFCLVFFLFYYYSTSTFIFLSIQLKSFATYWCCHPYFFSISFLFWQEIIKDVLQEIIKPDSAEKKGRGWEGGGRKDRGRGEGRRRQQRNRGREDWGRKEKGIFKIIFFYSGLIPAFKYIFKFVHNICWCFKTNN